MPKIRLDACVESVTRGVRLRTEQLKKLLREDKGDAKYLAQNEIEQGWILYHQLPFIKTDAVECPINEKYYLQPRDIVIAKSGKNVKAAIATANPGAIVVSGSLFIVRINSEMINPIIVFAYLNSKEGQLQLQDSCKNNNITPSSIRNIWIYSPNEEAQHLIVDNFVKSEEFFYKSFEAQNAIQQFFDSHR